MTVSRWPLNHHNFWMLQSRFIECSVPVGAYQVIAHLVVASAPHFRIKTLTAWRLSLDGEEERSVGEREWGRLISTDIV
jgi:hypothetical protein